MSNTWNIIANTIDKYVGITNRVHSIIVLIEHNQQQNRKREERKWKGRMKKTSKGKRHKLTRRPQLELGPKALGHA